MTSFTRHGFKQDAQWTQEPPPGTCSGLREEPPPTCTSQAAGLALRETHRGRSGTTLLDQAQRRPEFKEKANGLDRLLTVSAINCNKSTKCRFIQIQLYGARDGMQREGRSAPVSNGPCGPIAAVERALGNARWSPSAGARSKRGQSMSGGRIERRPWSKMAL